jgi:hypothetical protein
MVASLPDIHILPGPFRYPRLNALVAVRLHVTPAIPCDTYLLQGIDSTLKVLLRINSVTPRTKFEDIPVAQQLNIQSCRQRRYQAT